MLKNQKLGIVCLCLAAIVSLTAISTLAAFADNTEPVTQEDVFDNNEVLEPFSGGTSEYSEIVTPANTEGFLFSISGSSDVEGSFVFSDIELEAGNFEIISDGFEISEIEIIEGKLAPFVFTGSSDEAVSFSLSEINWEDGSFEIIDISELKDADGTFTVVSGTFQATTPAE